MASDTVQLIRERFDRINGILEADPSPITQNETETLLCALSKVREPQDSFAALLGIIFETLGALQGFVPEFRVAPLLRYVYHRTYCNEPQLFLPVRYPLLMRWAMREDLAGLQMGLVDLAKGRFEGDEDYSVNVLRNAAMRLRKWVQEWPVVSSTKLDDYLLLGQLNIAERCLMQCPYCSVGALPDDPLMDWDMFSRLVHHPKVLLGFNPIHLGDGEAMIWEDRKAGTDLSDVVRLLLSNGATEVEITTAGFTSNQAIPNRAVMRLRGEKNLALRVSFNFLGRMEKRAYIKKMEHTFRTLAECGILPKGVITLAQGKESLEQILEVLSGILLPIYGASLTDALIRADKRMRVGPDFSKDVEHIDEEIDLSSNCEAIRNSEMPDDPLNGSIALSGTYMRHTGRLSIRPNGDVIPSCKFPGKRSTKLGNVFENDAQQISRAYRQFLLRHQSRLARASAVGQCKIHQKNPILISPPKSKEPLIVR